MLEQARPIQHQRRADACRRRLKVWRGRRRARVGSEPSSGGTASSTSTTGGGDAPSPFLTCFRATVSRPIQHQPIAGALSENSVLGRRRFVDQKRVYRLNGPFDGVLSPSMDVVRRRWFRSDEPSSSWACGFGGWGPVLVQRTFVTRCGKSRKKSGCSKRNSPSRVFLKPYWRLSWRWKEAKRCLSPRAESTRRHTEGPVRAGLTNRSGMAEMASVSRRLPGDLEAQSIRTPVDVAAFLA